MFFLKLRGRLTCPASSMVHLYILENSSGKHYIGITTIDVRERLKRHNKGDIISTARGRPWKVVHQERFQDLRSAREREKQIKSWKGGNALRKLLSTAPGSSNGRTMDSGSINLGSNPSPGAVDGRTGGVK